MNDKIAKVRKFTLLSNYERRYVRLIKKHGALDRDFYLASQPKMHWLFRPYPERHYVTIGEHLGISPNPDFSPFAYFAANPDIPSSQYRPLLHYLEHGHAELRPTKMVDEAITQAEGEYPKLHRSIYPRRHDLAVVLHLYFLDLWPEFLDVIRSLDIEADVYVTVTNQGDDSKRVAAQIREDLPEAHVIETPNLGRDIFPFLHLLNSGLLDGYSAVCKVHSKKSLHRSDGATWRHNLVGDLLPGAGTAELVHHFLEARDVIMVTGDDQMYVGDKWWGSNLDRVHELLGRVEVHGTATLSPFPGGSMYWLKPLMVDMLRGMRFNIADFEPEHGQLDGTTAHAVERLFGFLADAAGMSVATVGEVRRPVPASGVEQPAFVSAFYLPQFHPTDYNDEWWGQGFTEWTGVTRAEQNFAGHVQPFLPGALGFYDLRLPETMAAQWQMAQSAGIDAFCVYHYWFDEERLLEEPLDNLMQRPDIDFPFYLCWANEAWRRNWDGLSGVTLMDQPYADGFEARLAKSVAPYMADARYQSPAGVPRFVVYRLDELPDPAGSVQRLREGFAAAGIAEVELGAVRFHLEAAQKPADDLVDFWVEMPPHEVVDASTFIVPKPPTSTSAADVRPFPGFRGLIYDYREVADRSSSEKYRRSLPANTIAGVMPGWDNTARRGNEAHLAWGASPASFRRWLERLRPQLANSSYRNELFINAWNEWGEKATVEPSHQYGDAYLRVLREILVESAPVGIGE